MDAEPRSERERDLLREITELTGGRPRARTHARTAPLPPVERPHPEAPEAPAAPPEEEL